MKNYFGFNLTGQKLLPVWILFMLCFFAPYVTLVLKMQYYQPGEKPSLVFFPLLLVLIIVAFIVSFYIVKMTIENVVYKEKTLVFNGSLGKYTGKVLLGLFLSIITFGIYMPWFIRDIHGYYIDSSSYDSNFFKFKAKAGKLFVILLLTIFVPMIILVVLMMIFFGYGAAKIPAAVLMQQVVMLFIMVPYMYLVYKWMINIDYKEFNISWDTEFWSACGKIALEMILTVITIGIYMPMAMLRLYQYFTERTVATSPDRKLSFGYDIDQLNDFLFIWGQTLLVIVTLGIYYPWSFCKICKRILNKTYILDQSSV